MFLKHKKARKLGVDLVFGARGPTRTDTSRILEAKPNASTTFAKFDF